jgi:hypothetical protein
MRLNPTRNRFTTISRSTNEPAVIDRVSIGTSVPVALSARYRSAAMPTLTAVPATATQNSCIGWSGIRSSRATPPIGSSVMSRVRMP